MKMENPCLLGDPELFDPVLLNPDLCAHRILQDMIANMYRTHHHFQTPRDHIPYLGDSEWFSRLYNHPVRHLRII